MADSSGTSSSSGGMRETTEMAGGGPNLACNVNGSNSVGSSSSGSDDGVSGYKRKIDDTRSEVRDDNDYDDDSDSDGSSDSDSDSDDDSSSDSVNSSGDIDDESSRSSSSSSGSSRNKKKSKSSKKDKKEKREKKHKKHKKEKREKKSKKESKKEKKSKKKESKRDKKSKKEKRSKSDKHDKKSSKDSRQSKDKSSSNSHSNNSSSVNQAAYGKYGILTADHYIYKQREFEIYMAEVKKLPGVLTYPRSEIARLFKDYMEDFNTATMPHEKYYDMRRFDEQESRQKALSSKYSDDFDPDGIDLEGGGGGGGGAMIRGDQDFLAQARREKKELERQKELAAARSKLLSQGDVRDAMKRQEALQMQMQAAYRIGDRATVAKIERMLKPDEPK